MADACCGFYRDEANLVRHRSRRSLSARAVSTNIPPAIIPLADVAPALVEALLDRAFEPERRQRTAYKVREGADWLPGLSFAALDEHDMLAGTIQCWPVALTDPAGKAHPMIMVGPVAVMPELQGSGYGKALMTAALAAIDPRAPLPQVMIGDPEYYGRFWGFSAEPTGGWQLPGPWEPRRLLVRCDNPAALPKAGKLGPWLG
jgi:predicted N-acetyltransferase YhbS